MKIRVALVQFDAVPEQAEANLREMERLAEESAEREARWVMFHESTTCDYTPRVEALAEPIPGGNSTVRMAELAERLGCYISFGLSEKDGERHYISQMFVGPGGFAYRYRKTWLWYDSSDEGYRNEWARYDPGTGPELFEIDGVQATCFICGDGLSPRCIDRAARLQPRVVFYPNNRSQVPDFDSLAWMPRQIRAPVLVTNRTGSSWGHGCQGGCVIYSADGEVLAKANREGREDVLVHDLDV